MKYEIAHEVFHVSPDGYELSRIDFAIKDIKAKVLFFFKEVENDNYWRIGEEQANITQIMNAHGATSCKYIYLVFDNAYLQIMNHNDDTSDPGRGFNVYSIKWFFETYFGHDEYLAFRESVDSFTQEVKEYLGYIEVKSLTSKSLINFRRIVDRSIHTFEYDKLLEISENGNGLEQTQFNIIKKQYIDDMLYTIMLGNGDFAESLITAEWLYDSMKKAKAIDLTVIAMGYFKAVEQLFYGLICLHKDENRKIWSSNQSKYGKYVDLTSENIEKDIINTTLGSLENFLTFWKNHDLMRNDLEKSKHLITAKFIEVRKLRNDYLHKHNIHDWSIIDLVRNMAFAISLLVLGSYKFSDHDKRQLGIPSTEPFTDYYRLCEYFDYHQNNLFCFERANGENLWVISRPDIDAEPVGNSYIKYSGIYFAFFEDPDKRIYSANKEGLPKSIYLGRMKFGWTEEIKFDQAKGMKIFENGKFIGNSIADEESFDY